MEAAKSVDVGFVSAWDIQEPKKQPQGVSELSSIIKNHASYISSAFQSTVALIRNGCLSMGNAGGKIAASRLFSVGKLPFALYELKNQIKTAYSSEDKEERWLSGFGAVETLGDIADTTTTFAEGLKAVGAVTEHMIRWSTPLFMVSIPLSAAGIAASSYGLYKTWKSSAKLSETVKGCGLACALAELGCKSDTYLSRHFRVEDPTVFRRRISRISQRISSGDKKAIEKGSELVKELKGRATQQIRSHALSILASTVATIGAVILLFAAFTPVGQALFAVASLIGLFSLAYHIKCKRDKFQSIAA